MSKKNIAIALGAGVLFTWLGSLAVQDAARGLKLEGADAGLLAVLVGLVAHVLPKPDAA